MRDNHLSIENNTTLGVHHLTVEMVIRQLSRETGLPEYFIYDFYERVQMGANPYEVAEALSIPEDKMVELHKKLFGKTPIKKEIVVEVPEEEEEKENVVDKKEHEEEEITGRRGVKYSDEYRKKLYKRIVELWKQGYNKTQIALRLHTSWQTIQDALKYYGIEPYMYRGYRDRREIEEKAVELFRQGYTKHRVAKTLGISWDMADKIYRQYIADKKPGVEKIVTGENMAKPKKEEKQEKKHIFIIGSYRIEIYGCVEKIVVELLDD